MRNQSAKSDARKRSKASKLCSTALGLALSGPISFFFCGLPAVALFGLLAAVLGIVGLVQLGSIPPVPRDAEDRPGVVRFSARIAENAPAKAWTAIVLGGLAFLGSSLLILIAMVAVGMSEG